MIAPTVGRVVWFHPDPQSAESGFASAETCAAIIAHVWSDTCVNLAVFDANGVPHPRTSVPLVQPEDMNRPTGFYCEWMPYQKKVAAGEIEPTLHAVAR